MTSDEFNEALAKEVKRAVKLQATWTTGQLRCVIIMPVHNALPYVKRTMEFFQNQGELYPLVIVDDASDAETSQYLRECASSMKFVSVLRNNRQQLFTRSVNRGLRYAYKTYSPKHMIVLNSDVDLFRCWEAGLLDLLDLNPDIGKVAYRDSTEPDLPDEYEEVKFPGYLTGHCFAVPTRVLEEVGVLCESDVGGAQCVFPELAHLHGLAHIGSDRHLTYKIQKAGYKTVYSNFPGCGHEAGKSWGHNLHWLNSFILEPLWPANDYITS